MLSVYADWLVERGDLINLDIHGSIERTFPLALAFPALARLELVNSVLETPHHPTLSTLVGFCPALHTGHFELPALRALTATGDPAYWFAPDALPMHPPPNLVELTNFRGAAFVRGLRTTPLLVQLRTLSIEATRDVLLVDPDSFQHLVLTCSGVAASHEERADLQARLATAFPAATFDVEVYGELSETSAVDTDVATRGIVRAAQAFMRQADDEA